MLKNKLEKNGFKFDNLFYERCDKFTSLLQEWGAVHNLTGAFHSSQIEDNIIDSIYPLKFLNDFHNFADIGTGAGYPGMLIAMAKPEVKSTLIEPRAKRVAFLNFVKNALELKNVEIIQAKAQDIMPASYDLITSRAVTNISLLLNLTQNLSDKNTEYLFYKGSLCADEIKEAKLDNYEVFSVGEHRNYLYMKQQQGFLDDI
jgi:16S rRNA (guanine527-N7)-methyltransferase